MVQAKMQILHSLHYGKFSLEWIRWDLSSSAASPCTKHLSVSLQTGQGSSPVVATQHRHAVHQQELLLQVPFEGHPRAAVVGWARHCPHPQELQTRKALTQMGPSFPPLPLLHGLLLTSILPPSWGYPPAPVILPAVTPTYKPLSQHIFSLHSMSCQLSSPSSHSPFTRLWPVLPFLRCFLPYCVSQDTPP